MAEGGLDPHHMAEWREEEGKEEEDIHIQIEELRVSEKSKKGAKCESCLRGDSSWFERSEREREERERRGERPWYDRVAVFMCFICQIYVCADCMPKHEGHEGMNVGRKESERKGLFAKMKERLQKAQREREKNERERMRRKYINKVMNESETERTKEFYSSHAVVCDRVEVKHELDKKEDSRILGLCGLKNKRWVVCDYRNSCIKIFKVGSNVLQRYIRFVGSRPHGVTEIHLKQNSAEPNLLSDSSSDISATDWADPNKQSLIAVTIPGKHQIMYINLSKNPIKTRKAIKTEGHCYYIQFYDDKIFTVCSERHLVSPWYVYIISTDGVTLNKFDTSIDDPHLAVVSGRVYFTDLYNDKVQCRNVQGQVVTDIAIEGSWPLGITVDPDNNVYVCAWKHNKVYKLDADLTRYKSVLDQTGGYEEQPDALCYYRDKLFISHYVESSSRNVVTVVRLL